MKTIQWMVTIFALLSLSACNSFFLQPKDVNSDSQWDCTEVDENGNWDCDEYDTEIDSKLEDSLSEPSVSSDPQETPSYAQSPRSNSTVQVKPYRAGLGTADAETSSGHANEAQTPEEMPEYVWLAYEPEAPTRIEDLPDDMYAVQLIAVSTKEKAMQYVEDETWLVEPTGVRVLSNGKPYYVILLGIYETKRRAELAVRSIADDVGSNKPWIRSLSSLQTAIKDANRKLGTNY